MKGKIQSQRVNQISFNPKATIGNLHPKTKQNKIIKISKLKENRLLTKIQKFYLQTVSF